MFPSPWPGRAAGSPALPDGGVAMPVQRGGTKAAGGLGLDGDAQRASKLRGGPMPAVGRRTALRLRPVVVEGRVPADAAERDRVVKDQVSEEAAVLIAPRGILGEEETVLLELLPEPLGRQRMVLGSVPRTDDRTFQSPTDRIAGGCVAELHAQCRRRPSIYLTVRGRGPRREARVPGTGPMNRLVRGAMARPKRGARSRVQPTWRRGRGLLPGSGDLGRSLSASGETPPDATLRRR